MSSAVSPMDAWRQIAPAFDPGFNEPVVRERLIAAADLPSAFAAALDNIRCDLDAQPWLAEVASYDWVLDRSNYNVPVEVLNQQRVLNALAGLADLAEARDWQSAARAVAARQTFRWRLEDAAPQLVRHDDWRFVVVPYAWDNLVYLLIAGLRAHMAERGTASPLFDPVPTVAEWRRPAKGLWLAALPLEGAAAMANDGFALAEMRAADESLADAIISQHECKDDVARTMWSISSDFVVGHEIAHAILHCDRPSSAGREIQADQAGLFALWKWIRPRDLTSLAPDHSPGLYDYVSALAGMMMLMTAGALQEGAYGPAAASLVAETRHRAEIIRRFTADNPQATSIKADEYRLAEDLVDAFEAFLTDMLAFHRAIPPRVAAIARKAGADAVETMAGDLAEHKRALTQ